MKIIGIIPARYASTRFPGKPLIQIAGKSMIQRTWEQACKAKLLSEVIIATDDERIKTEAENFGATVAMTSANHHSGTDRCAEVVSKLNDADAVINIQGDEPFIHPDQIDVLASTFINNNQAEIVTLIKAIELQQEIENPNVVKVARSSNGQALYFSRSVIPYQRDKTQHHFTYFKHIGIYGYRKDVLMKIVSLQQSTLEITESLEQLRWMENGYHIETIITNFENQSIDTPDDLEKIKEVYV